MDFGKEFKKYATKHQGINSMHVENYVGVLKNNDNVLLQKT